MPLAIITGANRGLGLEFARQYVDAGWDVVAINRHSSDALDALAETGRLRIIAADLTDDASLAAAVEQIPEDRADLLINNAGTMGKTTFAESGFEHQTFGSFDRDEWHAVFDINVCTPMALTELLAARLEAAEHGIVVTLSSMLGSNALNTMGNSYAYRASKAAVNSLMKSMGANLADRGITAIALHPGWVRTDMGGADAELDPREAVNGCIRTIAKLTPADSGKFFGYHGQPMPY